MPIRREGRDAHLYREKGEMPHSIERERGEMPISIERKGREID